MVRPLDESGGSSPSQGHGSWLMCEVALRQFCHTPHMPSTLYMADSNVFKLYLGKTKENKKKTKKKKKKKQQTTTITITKRHFHVLGIPIDVPKPVFQTAHSKVAMVTARVSIPLPTLAHVLTPEILDIFYFYSEDAFQMWKNVCQVARRWVS